MRFASRTAGLGGESDAWEVHDRALERIRRGQDVLVLSIGDPDFDTPPRIRDAAVRALADGRTHYSPSAGERGLRAAIAAMTSPLASRPVAATQVTVFPGAQAALYAVAQCLLEPGDEVIVPDPMYVTYPATLAAAGARPVPVRLPPERGFHLDPRAVARAVGPATRAILINFPHNPTGAVLTREEAEALAEICARHDLVLISDEVYSSLTFSRRPFSPAAVPTLIDRLVIVSSLSKSHAMTGWRCGWTVAPPPLAHHLERLARCMHFGVSQFVQDAGATALREAGYETAALREQYLERATAAVAALGHAPGLVVRMPEAGMYVFADIRGTGRDGWTFARELLDRAGVAVTPGEGFGEGGAGHVRIALGLPLPRLVDACRRIVAFCAGVRGSA